MDGGADLSEGRSWSDTPASVVDMAAVFSPRRKGRLPVRGELTSGGLISYQGNQQRGTPLTAPLVIIITSWDLGQVGRSVLCLRHRGSKHWSGRGCTESKRTAIWSGLAIKCPLFYFLIISSSSFPCISLFCIFLIPLLGLYLPVSTP